MPVGTAQHPDVQVAGRHRHRPDSAACRPGARAPRRPPSARSPGRRASSAAPSLPGHEAEGHPAVSKVRAATPGPAHRSMPTSPSAPPVPPPPPRRSCRRAGRRAIAGAMARRAPALGQRLRVLGRQADAGQAGGHPGPPRRPRPARPSATRPAAWAGRTTRWPPRCPRGGRGCGCPRSRDRGPAAACNGRDAPGHRLRPPPGRWPCSRSRPRPGACTAPPGSRPRAPAAAKPPPGTCRPRA